MASNEVSKEAAVEVFAAYPEIERKHGTATRTNKEVLQLLGRCFDQTESEETKPQRAALADSFNTFLDSAQAMKDQVKSRSEVGAHIKDDRIQKVIAKTFAVPELAEMILLHLNMLELLQVQQVSRQFLDATLAAPRIVKRMRALVSKGLKLPWDLRDNGKYAVEIAPRLRMEDYSDDDSPHHDLMLLVDDDFFLPLSNAWARLQAMQVEFPPLQEAFPMCGSCWSPIAPSIEVPSGIKLEHLLRNRAEHMKEKHSESPQNMRFYFQR